MPTINQLEQQLEKDKEMLWHLDRTIADCDFMLDMLNCQIPFLEKHPYVKLIVCDTDKEAEYPITRSITLEDPGHDTTEIFKAIIEGKKTAAEMVKKKIEAKYT